MPTDNHKKERENAKKDAERLSEQWDQEQIIHPLEGDVDNEVRRRLEEQRQQQSREQERR